MNILFRCDGSVEIGMGHIVRCLALADELNDNYDCNITFAMRQSNFGNQKVADYYNVISEESEEIDTNYKKWLIKCIQGTNAEILILDVRDGLTRSFLKKIKQVTNVKVITIDDPEDKRMEANLAFYPPVPQVKEMNWTNFKGKLFTGWEYVILRKEFLKTYSNPENVIPNIFVSMGATDPKNMIELVVESLSKLHLPFHANIVIGEGYSKKEKLIKKLTKVNFSHKLLINPQNIADNMVKSDLAIISFGQTAYELASIGIPAIHLCLSNDHEKSSEVFELNNIGFSAGVFNNCSTEKLSDIVTNNLIGIGKRKQYSQTIQSVLKNSNNLIARIIKEV